MAKNPALVTGRRSVQDKPNSPLLAVVALVLWVGCSAGGASASLRATSGPQSMGLATADTPARARAERHEDMPPAEGCATPPPGWPDLSSDGLIAFDTEELLAPFFTCTSPAAFVALQRGVDMVRLVR